MRDKADQRLGAMCDKAVSRAFDASASGDQAGPEGFGANRRRPRISSSTTAPIAARARQIPHQQGRSADRRGLIHSRPSATAPAPTGSLERQIDGGFSQNASGRRLTVGAKTQTGGFRAAKALKSGLVEKLILA